MDYRDDHPERQPDETFLGNVSLSHFAEVSWTTKRLGSVAYGTNGKQIYERVRPLFVKTDELSAG
jgi:hypothetical protein